MSATAGTGFMEQETMDMIIYDFVGTIRRRRPGKAQ